MEAGDAIRPKDNAIYRKRFPRWNSPRVEFPTFLPFSSLLSRPFQINNEQPRSEEARASYQRFTLVFRVFWTLWMKIASRMLRRRIIRPFESRERLREVVHHLEKGLLDNSTETSCTCRAWIRELLLVKSDRSRSEDVTLVSRKYSKML